MSARLADDDAAVLDAAGTPLLFGLLVFLILGTLAIAGALL
jgi:hypothetical protein